MRSCCNMQAAQEAAARQKAEAALVLAVQQAAREAAARQQAEAARAEAQAQAAQEAAARQQAEATLVEARQQAMAQDRGGTGPGCSASSVLGRDSVCPR
jgi:hypothetical protein